MLGRKIVFVVDAGTGVFGRLRIFCHQCQLEFIVEVLAAIPGSKLKISLALPATLALLTLLSTDLRWPFPGSDELLSSNDCGDRVFARSRGRCWRARSTCTVFVLSPHLGRV